MAEAAAPKAIKEPIHVFDIPSGVVDVLSLRASSLAANPIAAATASGRPATPVQSRQLAGAAPSCTTCGGAILADVKDQRAHFRSDWHRYNVKMRLQDSSYQPVSEQQFAKLVEDLAESLSGSESTTGSSSSGPEDTVSTLLQRKQKGKLNQPETDDGDLPIMPRSAIAWFHAPNDYPDTQFGIYTSLFPLGMEPAEFAKELKHMQNTGPGGRLWTMLATAGGHFAGIVVRVQIPPEDQLKSGKKKDTVEMEIIKHKTFHRYTTRRKQGGSQSVNDNAKGPAKSAGAQLRRYGEQALREDIQGILTEWAEDVQASERIFFRASVSNRKMFWDWDGSPIKKGDNRLRTFPFPTRRPTQAELMRCLVELTRVKVSHLTEDALRSLDEAQLASLPKPKPSIPKQVPTVDKPIKEKPAALSKEEEAIRDKWRRLIDMVAKGRIDPLKSFWERNSDFLSPLASNTPIPEWAQVQETRGLCTLLQVASAAGQEVVTQWLLEEERADPTIAVPSGASAVSNLQAVASDSEGETSRAAGQARKAYHVAANRATRNVFRRAAYAHQDWYDWKGAAGVPSVLSPEMEAERDKKKMARRTGLRDKLRERERAREEQERAEAAAAKEAAAKEKEAAAKARLEAPSTGPQRLGGAGGASGLGGANGLAGLTPEMRAKIERERRARAAEARLSGR
ncbi:cytoplasm protein [Ceratobasidium sp. AG-Ba]|nr:cytoplasm protein [Ceratobasidium sp. AG-Ba]